ncbi:serine hydrolase [Oleiphilus sp. HI0080]|uniref:serine hydrolase domain-containing protein n=1 Tax=Oleiphilus sp. HI0080 TaxID=1822255 RepID=UPI0009EE7D84|nr:serine hydrolase domain-containing protein [Oleiphilus sp. HI0080]
MLRVILYSLAITASGNVFAETNPIEEALKKPGALPELPVSAAKEPFSPEFVRSARQSFSNMHWQMAGDHSLYYNLHMSEMMQTGIASPNMAYKPLVRDIKPELAALTTQTGQGELSLAEYVEHPIFKLQAIIFVHKGKVVYEAYPGMKPSDRKIWASSAKTTVGLIMAMLVAEGKVEMEQPVTKYVPELKGTIWDTLSVASVVNMTTGLDNEETLESILNPESAVVQYFSSIAAGGDVRPDSEKNWIDVARDQKPLEGEKPGDVFRYASLNTQVLTQLIENVENKTWTQVFEDRVWSKVYARQPAFFNIAPGGSAMPVGFLSTTPEDMARFAALFTPSWSAVATEQVVSREHLDLIYADGEPARYKNASKRKSSMGSFNEYAISNAYQFDFIFDDGAMAKSGNMNQMIYMDPNRDFAAIALSNSPYHSGYGESKAPAYFRLAAKALADQ